MVDKWSCYSSLCAKESLKRTAPQPLQLKCAMTVDYQSQEETQRRASLGAFCLYRSSGTFRHRAAERHRMSLQLALV